MHSKSDEVRETLALFRSLPTSVIRDVCFPVGEYGRESAREFADIVLAFVDRAGLADAGMGDKEGVEVGEQRPRGHQPNLLFHRRGKGKDCSPLAKDRRGVEVSCLFDEGINP